MSDKEKLNGVDQVSKIEAIKNIIFGETIAEYNSSFEAIKQDIDSKKEFLENYIDDVRKELEEHIDSLSTDIGIKLTDLEAKLEAKTAAIDAQKVDKKQLSKLLITLGEKIGN